ncbi:MAG: hypothetical protein ACRCXM_13495 [Beijerinckiaceae bacterium]
MVSEQDAELKRLGAAVAQVSGEVDQVFSGVSCDVALAEAESIARKRPCAAGATLHSLKTIDVEDIPIAYLPGGLRRVRLRVVRDIALPAPPSTILSSLSSNPINDRFGFPDCDNHDRGFLGRFASSHEELTDVAWEAIMLHLPNNPRGVQRIDDRQVLNGASGACALACLGPTSALFLPIRFAPPLQSP